MAGAANILNKVLSHYGENANDPESLQRGLDKIIGALPGVTTREGLYDLLDQTARNPKFSEAVGAVDTWKKSFVISGFKDAGLPDVLAEDPKTVIALVQNRNAIKTFLEQEAEKTRVLSASMERATIVMNDAGGTSTPPVDPATLDAHDNVQTFIVGTGALKAGEVITTGNSRAILIDGFKAFLETYADSYQAMKNTGLDESIYGTMIVAPEIDFDDGFSPDERAMFSKFIGAFSGKMPEAGTIEDPSVTGGKLNSLQYSALSMTLSNLGMTQAQFEAMIAKPDDVDAYIKAQFETVSYDPSKLSLDDSARYAQTNLNAIANGLNEMGYKIPLIDDVDGKFGEQSNITLQAILQVTNTNQAMGSGIAADEAWKYTKERGEIIGVRDNWKFLYAGLDNSQEDTFFEDSKYEYTDLDGNKQTLSFDPVLLTIVLDNLNAVNDDPSPFKDDPSYKSFKNNNFTIHRDTQYTAANVQLVPLHDITQNTLDWFPAHVLADAGTAQALPLLDELTREFTGGHGLGSFTDELGDMGGYQRDASAGRLERLQNIFRKSLDSSGSNFDALETVILENLSVTTMLPFGTPDQARGYDNAIKGALNAAKKRLATNPNDPSAAAASFANVFYELQDTADLRYGEAGYNTAPKATVNNPFVDPQVYQFKTSRSFENSHVITAYLDQNVGGGSTPLLYKDANGKAFIAGVVDGRFEIQEIPFDGVLSANAANLDQLKATLDPATFEKFEQAFNVAAANDIDLFNDLAKRAKDTPDFYSLRADIDTFDAKAETIAAAMQKIDAELTVLVQDKKAELQSELPQAFRDTYVNSGQAQTDYIATQMPAALALLDAMDKDVQKDNMKRFAKEFGIEKDDMTREKFAEIYILHKDAGFDAKLEAHTDAAVADYVASPQYVSDLAVQVQDYKNSEEYRQDSANVLIAYADGAQAGVILTAAQSALITRAVAAGMDEATFREESKKEELARFEKEYVSSGQARKDFKVETVKAIETEKANDPTGFTDLEDQARAHYGMSAGDAVSSEQLADFTIERDEAVNGARLFDGYVVAKVSEYESDPLMLTILNEQTQAFNVANGTAPAVTTGNAFTGFDLGALRGVMVASENFDTTGVATSASYDVNDILDTYKKHNAGKMDFEKEPLFFKGGDGKTYVAFVAGDMMNPKKGPNVFTIKEVDTTAFKKQYEDLQNGIGVSVEELQKTRAEAKETLDVAAEERKLARKALDHQEKMLADFKGDAADKDVIRKAVREADAEFQRKDIAYNAADKAWGRAETDYQNAAFNARNKTIPAKMAANDPLYGMLEGSYRLTPEQYINWSKNAHDFVAVSPDVDPIPQGKPIMNPSSQTSQTRYDMYVDPADYKNQKGGPNGNYGYRISMHRDVDNLIGYEVRLQEAPQVEHRPDGTIHVHYHLDVGADRDAAVAKMNFEINQLENSDSRLIDLKRRHNRNSLKLKKLTKPTDIAEAQAEIEATEELIKQRRDDIGSSSLFQRRDILSSSGYLSVDITSEYNAVGREYSNFKAADYSTQQRMLATSVHKYPKIMGVIDRYHGKGLQKPQNPIWFYEQAEAGNIRSFEGYAEFHERKAQRGGITTSTYAPSSYGKGDLRGQYNTASGAYDKALGDGYDKRAREQDRKIKRKNRDNMKKARKKGEKLGSHARKLDERAVKLFEKIQRDVADDGLLEPQNQEKLRELMKDSKELDEDILEYEEKFELKDADISRRFFNETMQEITASWKDLKDPANIPAHGHNQTR